MALKTIPGCPSWKSSTEAIHMKGRTTSTSVEWLRAQALHYGIRKGFSGTLESEVVRDDQRELIPIETLERTGHASEVRNSDTPHDCVMSRDLYISHKGRPFEAVAWFGDDSRKKAWRSEQYDARDEIK